jgi:hypothetical protein
MTPQERDLTAPFAQLIDGHNSRLPRYDKPLSTAPGFENLIDGFADRMSRVVATEHERSIAERNIFLHLLDGQRVALSTANDNGGEQMISIS